MSFSPTVVPDGSHTDPIHGLPAVSIKWSSEAPTMSALLGEDTLTVTISLFMRSRVSFLVFPVNYTRGASPAVKLMVGCCAEQWGGCEPGR